MSESRSAARFNLKDWAAWISKAGMTALLLWIVFRKVPLQGILAAMTRVDPGLTVLSVLVFLAGTTILESLRLAAAGSLLRERPPSFPAWLRLYLESRPFFYLLPGAVAAEGMVWMRLRQFQWRHVSCGFAVLSTRIWGVAVWGIAAAFALARPNGTSAMLAQAPAWMRNPWVWLAGAGFTVIAAALAPWAMGRWKGLPVVEHTGLPLLWMALSSAGSAGVITIAVLLASRAAGTPLPFHAALGLMAIFNFAMVLPISLGGLGLQEALAALLGPVFGYSLPAMIAFSALMHLQRVVLSLAGLGIFLAGRPANPSGPEFPSPGEPA
jgi:uncharacterized membrane protein YbhN (UPF0104 family)